MEVVSLETARTEGLLRYFTGRPCSRGHISERAVSSRACLMCAAENMRKHRGKDVVASRKKANAQQKVRRAKNSEKHIVEVRAWQKANPEKRRATTRRWKKNNPDKRRVDIAKRRALVLNLTCVCCDLEDFEAVYREARLSGGQVDHRVPLALGGLHCVENLQVLTVEAHREKTSKDITAIRKKKKNERVTA